MRQNRRPASVIGNVQKSPSSKAAAILTRGAYIEYVSTAKWRERRWRLFSTFPNINTTSPAPEGRPWKRKRKDSTAIVSSGYLLIDCLHTGALSGVIVGRKFLFSLTFLRIPEELLYSHIVKRLSIAVPFCLYLNAGRNFRH